MNRLIDYWPSLEAINGCIRTEAETADDAVLLAVHEPVPLKVREVGTGAEQPRTEQELLDAFLAPADDGSAVVVAITGDSGVGKSHMIRWLHAQLQRHPRRERFVVVLVPKTASLREVVERMLAPLDGKEYERLRQELGRATDTLSPEAASRMLATALTIELKAREKQWIAELKSGNSNDRSLRERALHARGLQTVLFQGETFDHWLYPVLLRIVGQALKGGSESASGDARRFMPSDLEVPADFDVTAVSREAQLYISHLQGNDGAGTSTAARVLQDELDAALRSVFRFSEALGQRTLEEIVNDIRTRLLADGKELVLLIEDFAALAGIQETLLSLMISESDHGGRRIRAPLRTALAVTDGFLPSRQTILTRAKREWVIPNAGSSEGEIIQRLTRMAGRYLNAARWGTEALREQFKASEAQDLYSWVRPFALELEDDERERLDAFGTSDSGYPLFPLSTLAVGALARREMTVDGKLLFNPRKFINAVLRDVLLKRQAQVQGQFPPARFKAATLRTDADLELRSQGHASTVQERLVPALALWAGDPRSLSDAPSVREPLFAAFGLPWPFLADGRTGIEPPTPTPMPKPVIAADPVAPAPRPDLGTPGMEEDLEAWATGALPQARANRLRTVLASALGQRMDWNSLRMAYGQIKKEFFWLPYAPVGNPTANPKFVVAPEVRPVPATTRRALAALDRWEANGGSWNYAKAEDDYAYAQALLDQLEEQAREYFVGKAEREAAALGRTLHRQALLLRVTKKTNPANLELPKLLAQPAPVHITDALREMTHLGKLLELQERAAQSRDELRRLYLGAVCCFQGDGGTPHAVDATRVANAWKVSEDDSGLGYMKLDVALGNVIAEMSSARLQSVTVRYGNAVKSMRPALIELTGPTLDAALPAALRALISSARKAGVLVTKDTSLAELEGWTAWLEAPGVREFIRGVFEFTEPASDERVEAQLAKWARVDLSLLGKSYQVIDSIATVIRATQRNALAQLRVEGGADVAEKMDRLIASLRSLGDAP